MQLTGMLHGARLLDYVEFPAAEVLGPGATEDEIQGLIERHKLVFIKPLFRGGVGKKNKSGLICKATDLKTALKEKERLYFVEHRHGNTVAKANGVTFESGLPAEHEVYFAITDSTEFRARRLCRRRRWLRHDLNRVWLVNGRRARLMEFNQNTRSTDSRTGKRCLANLKKSGRPLADFGNTICSKTDVCGALEGSGRGVLTW